MEAKQENNDLNQDNLQKPTEEVKPEDAEKVSGGAVDSFIYFQDYDSTNKL